MKSPTWLSAIASTLIGVLVATLPSAAKEPPQHHQYKLVDLGTLGGPNGYLPGAFFEGTTTQSLSAAGRFAGAADTAIPDPYDVCFNEDCMVSHAVQWWRDSLTDLGTLPGTGDFSSTATWISANGLIAGLSENGEIDPTVPGFPELHAVLWKHGKITDLGTLEGGYESIAQAVNSGGEVVGFAVNGVPDDHSIVGFPTQTRAFRWQNGAMQDIGTLPGGTDAVALMVNEGGQIVGQSYTGDSVPPPDPSCGDFPLTLHGFFWDNGKMVDLGTLGGSCTFTYALNNRGQVVGQSTLSGDQTSHPYFWDGNKMTDLGTLGGTYGYAAWLNDSGAVVGSATPAGDQALIAFLWKRGKTSNLGTLPGNGCSAADAVNSRGQIVGGSGFYIPDFFADCTDPVEHAVLWENGTILDLNDFVPQGYDLILNEAFFINDSGVISGVGTVSDGSQHAFLLIPCDGGSHSEGCIDGAESTTAATLGNLARVKQSASAGTRSSAGPRGLSSRMLRHFRLTSTTVISGTNATLSPTSLTFSTWAIGTKSVAKSVTLANDGSANLTVSGIAITGPNAGDFAETHTCGGSLAPGASCSISVTFKPTASGTRTAALTVTDNTAGSPQKVALSGTGTTAKLSPRSLNFPAQTLGTTSAVKTATLTNVGATTFSVSSIAFTGVNAGDFAETHTCGTSLTPGASCNISVTFRPTATGTRTAKLSITDNAAGSPQKVQLSGFGMSVSPYNHCVVSGGVLTGACTRYGGIGGVCSIQLVSTKCPIGQPAKNQTFSRCRNDYSLRVDLSTGC
jgi:probable HAF family extracellular repeat protein